MNQTEFNVMKMAYDAIVETTSEMTVGDRFTNAGQSLLDCIIPLKEAIEKQDDFLKNLDIAREAVNNLQCDEAYEQDCNVCTISEFLYVFCGEQK